MGGGGSTFSDNWWILLVIPLVSGLVGYITNVAAVKLTLYPTNFVGLNIWQPDDQPFGICGWQGIIPAKAGKMVTIITELMKDKLFDISEVFQRIEPEQILDLIREPLQLNLPNLLEELARTECPQVWRVLPDIVKQEIFQAVRDAAILETFVVDLLSEITSNVEDILDLTLMNYELAVQDRSKVTQVFLRCAAKEFKFIENLGFFLGVIFGIPIAIASLYLREIWFLVLGGLVVGFVTNWIAVKLIFRPIKPWKLGPLTIQGAFHKRKEEVSAEFSKVTRELFINAENLWQSILQGPKAAGLKQIVSNVVVRKYLPYTYHYTNEAIDIEDEMRVKLIALSAMEYEEVLRPAFREDEIKLILVGAILGAGAGALQGLIIRI